MTYSGEGQPAPEQPGPDGYIHPAGQYQYPPTAHQPPVPGYPPPDYSQTGYPPPDYSQTGYPQPGYPQPGYPPPGYQPPGFPPPGYQPAASYPPPGYPYAYAQLVPVKPPRPGGVGGAAVLAFIQGGLVLLAGIGLLAGTSSFSDLGLLSSRSNSLSSYGTELIVIAVVTLLAGGLLIAGGIGMYSGKSAVLVAGCVLSLVLSVYWVARVSSVMVVGGAVVTWAILLAVMPIISLALAQGTEVKRWLAGRRAQAPS